MRKSLLLRRSPFRYSLRSLLVLATVISLAMGYVVKEAQDRKHAVQTIQEFGGSVHWRHQMIAEAPPGPAWLRRVIGDEFFFQADTVSLLGPRFNDKNVRAIKHLSEVRRLTSYTSEITDEGLRHFRDLSQLEELYLSNLPITDQGLVHLEGLRKLKVLQIYACSLDVTDEGKRRLVRALPQFEPKSHYTARSGTIMLGE